MPTAVSLFSGAGGFCEGVRLAGFKVVCAVEMDGYAIRTHSANFPKVPMFRGDVTRFLIDAQPGVPSKRELIDGGVDLVYGGPPCQGFSQIGPRDLKDPRNLLYLEFARVLKALKPKAFIMENVPNMVAMKNGHFRDLIFSALKGAGYHNTILVPLTASEYGVPQHRRRVFFVGTRNDLASPTDLAVLFNRHLSANQSEREITVREAISDLPRRVSLDDGTLPYPKLRLKIPSDYQRAMRLDCESPLISKHWKNANLDGAALLHNHHTKGIEARRKRIVRAMKPGMCGDSLPATLWKGTRPYKWRRLDPDEPSYTILAQMQRDLSEWIHPTHDRWITVREAARLQSFHDGFVFVGSERQQLKQVGNAVPPLLGYAVASAAQRLLRAI
ncbi:DNA cytosine methyltransferase [Bradyrhizobium sp. Ash2021]|uniref:DNA cytosine methyltransferase n=1 Tax=Bradyrhizobium sp. Ash2021 TaxID=2954771 RepID=UPI002815C7E4|nr:DNA cytosine methyltransferase [Bradyrhizobium sp. Ash2021]WMT70956.1 DNA cytosine methyltransferase [Bradyrhizobium sp. Ash2021]